MMTGLKANAGNKGPLIKCFCVLHASLLKSLQQLFKLAAIGGIDSVYKIDKLVSLTV